MIITIICFRLVLVLSVPKLSKYNFNPDPSTSIDVGPNLPAQSNLYSKLIKKIKAATICVSICDLS